MPVGSASQVPSTRPPEGYFICQEQGLQTLKGVAEPMPVYRVLEESGTQSRLDVATSRGLAPLVGREQAEAKGGQHAMSPVPAYKP